MSRGSLRIRRMRRATLRPKKLLVSPTELTLNNQIGRTARSAV